MQYNARRSFPAHIFHFHLVYKESSLPSFPNSVSTPQHSTTQFTAPGIGYWPSVSSSAVRYSPYPTYLYRCSLSIHSLQTSCYTMRAMQSLINQASLQCYEKTLLVYIQAFFRNSLIHSIISSPWRFSGQANKKGTDQMNAPSPPPPPPPFPSSSSNGGGGGGNPLFLESHFCLCIA